ncbi:MAG: SDR family oxidoreductase [Sphingomonadales bacterium]|nr:SDR family oxidoreductase [Sphingomonadales bacterium]
MSFKGEVALVTGAGKGFGRSIALTLAGQGSAVALVARTASDVEAVAAEIAAAGGTALPIAADVTQAPDVERSIRETQARFGPITQFVNNAGVGWPYGPVAGMDVARWWQAQQLHQLAPMLYLSRLLPKMRENGRGRAVIVSARASHATVGGMSAYITGKTAQVRIVNVAAMENADAGLAIFAIDPGFVVTDLARETMTSPEAKAHLPGMVDRLGEASTRDFSGDLAACGQRVADLLSGRYDALSGRYFEMQDDLDAALASLKEAAA